MRSIDAATQICAVIGNPVEHSLSPVIHNAAFEALGLNFVYVAFRVEDVRACLAGMRAMQGFRGMSVTIPHKLAVMGCLDEIDPMAQKVGSVNTVFNDNGILRGSTTDGPGTLRAFAEAGVSLEGKKVLFAGAGGAVRAVAFAFADLSGAAHITVLGRTQSRLDSLVNDLKSKTSAAIRSGSLSYDLKKEVPEHDVLIQGTPTGMYPDSIDETLIPPAALHPNHVVFDMVYRPLKTRLIREAEAIGCRVIYGTEMLLNQAALQFELWTGQPAPLAIMREALRKELNRENDATFRPTAG